MPVRNLKGKKRQLARSISLWRMAVFAVLIGATLLSLVWWLWSVSEKRSRAVELSRERNNSPLCDVQFVGGSTIERWVTLAADMAPLQVTNIGVGGATIDDVTGQFTGNERLAIESQLDPSLARSADSKNTLTPVVGDEAPQAIVFYAGENDIVDGKSAQNVEESFKRFLDVKRERFGNTPVYFVSIKPTPARQEERVAQAEVNRSIKMLASRSNDVRFIDIMPAMLIAGHIGPYYAADGVHMNAEGYARWTPIVRQALRPFLERQQAGKCHT